MIPQQIQPYLIGAFAAALCVVCGLFIGRRGFRRLRTDADQLEARLARAESQSKEQSRLVSRMRSERGTVANLALSLPIVVRELNRRDLDRRRVPSLILQLAESIFQPGQALFYVTCNDDNGTPTELRLIAHQGMAEVPEGLQRLRLGEGKIGWVAEKRVEMLKDDWLNPTRTDGRTILDNHPILEPDIIGPLIGPSVRSTTGEDLLGVLCLGAPGIRPRDEKLMFQLVTNLGSLALVNADIRSRLKQQANHDGLTGLLNKRFFMEALGGMIFEAGREARPLSLFLFDIDHFKNYNDTNGHPAGDELLRQISALLRKSVRPGDLCCRYGGEEFIVAMPGTDGTTGLQVAERIRHSVEEYAFEHGGKQPGGALTISGGVAEFPRDGRESTDLVRHADETLYDSKRSGRNRVARYRGVEIGDAAHGDEVDHEHGPATPGVTR